MIQEEKESEIKKLRKSLNFKAKPLPPFYKGQTKPRVKKVRCVCSSSYNPLTLLTHEFTQNCDCMILCYFLFFLNLSQYITETGFLSDLLVRYPCHFSTTTVPNLRQQFIMVEVPQLAMGCFNSLVKPIDRVYTKMSRTPHSLCNYH